MELTRRQMLGTAATAVVDGILRTRSCRATAPPSGDAPHLARPLPRQVVWQDCEVGLIYHFDLSVAAGRDDRGNNAYREVFDPKLYNPTDLDTDQWIEAAKAAGARYAVFTATHFNGFMQWQSDLYPYGLKQAAWRGGSTVHPTAPKPRVPV